MPTDAEVRAKIASVALAYVGSQAWVDSVAKENYPANTNKCNLFVYDILTQAGATPGLPHGHWFWHRYPPNAGDWANPTYDIEHWRVLRPGEKPEPGDVIAQDIAYSDATGHVMIMGQGDFVIGTGDRGPGSPGTIEHVPRPSALGPRPLGPEVFRRYDSTVR